MISSHSLTPELQYRALLDQACQEASIHVNWNEGFVAALRKRGLQLSSQLALSPHAYPDGAAYQAPWPVPHKKPQWPRESFVVWLEEPADPAGWQLRKVAQVALASRIERLPNAKPYIKWDHTDGPLLVCADGTPHWLTLWESLCVRAGILKLDRLDRKYNSKPRHPAG